MKRAAFKLVSKPIYFLATIIARRLPGLKEDYSMEVYPESPVLPVSLPVNFDTLPENLARSFVKHKRIPPRRIFVLNNVYVNRRTVIFKNLKIFIPSLPWLKDLPAYRNGKLLLKQWLIHARTTSPNELVALAYDEWSVENYYHWMIESLPRLALIQMYYPNCMLIFPQPAKEYIEATVAVMGFNRLLYLNRDKENFLNVSHLVFPELVYYDDVKEVQSEITNKSYEELIVTVRKKLLNHYCPKTVVPKKRTYISRAKQTKRRLVNEEEIKPVLEKYGFEIIYFEDMSFTQQIAIMFETKIFLGLHGANMVNILFMQEGAKVIELMNKDFLNDAYYLLASSVKLPYYSVPCTMADESIKPTDDMITLNDADVLVDKDRLEETILMALNEEKDSTF